MTKERRGMLSMFLQTINADFNIFLDPPAEKTVMESELDITLIAVNNT